MNKSKSANHGSLLLRIFGLILIIIGPIFLLVSLAMWQHAKDLKNWKTAQARVIRSDVETSTKLAGHRPGRMAKIYDYTPRIEYTYTVDGERFSDDNIGPSGLTSYSRSDAEQWTRKYPLGSTITIHYSPSKPDWSAIVPTKNTFGNAFLFVFGIMAIPGGLIMRHIGKNMDPAYQRTTAQRAVQKEAVRPQPNHQHLVGQSMAAPMPTKPRKSKPKHWSIRTAGVLIGLVLFFLGGVSLPLGVRQIIQANDAVNPGDATPRLIATVIMGLFVVFGAQLIWMGMKRDNRSALFGP